MSDRITNGELDEILAHVKQMWEALGDVAMQVPAAREIVAPRRHLPQVIDMVFDQAKEAGRTQSESEPMTEQELTVLIDYHDNQDSAAEAMGHDDASLYHALRSDKYSRMRDALKQRNADTLDRMLKP